MESRKQLVVDGQIFRLYRTNLTLNQALKIVGELSPSRQVLIRNDVPDRWTVYWFAKKSPTPFASSRNIPSG